MGTSFNNALESIRTTRVWKSIFRRGPAITNRTRSLAVFGNLLLHWLPVKVREKSLRVRAAYYLGSLSLLLFVVLVVTGVLLMFYYRPATPTAYYDMKDLRFVVSNGVLLRNMHRVAAHLMVLMVFCAHGSRVLSRRIQTTPRVQLGGWHRSAAPHVVPELYGLPAALGSVGILGDYCGNEHNFRRADRRKRSSFRGLGWTYRRREHVAAVLRAPCSRSPAAGVPLHRRAYLAFAEGWRTDGGIQRR